MLAQNLRIEHLRQIIAKTNIGKNPAGQRTLTDELRIKGGLFLGGKKDLTELPDKLTVGGDLLVRGTGLKTLPENLKVLGSLYLADTKITTLPPCLRVYGNLDIRRTKIKEVPPRVCLGSVLRTEQDAENENTGIHIPAFLEVTGLPEMPKPLRQLITFQDNNGRESFCQGFCIYAQDNSVMRAWTTSCPLIEQLHCLGQASASGSLYALWHIESAKPLDEQPIVALGDEGGAWLVAKNFAEFLRLLSFDAEPTISKTGITYDKDPQASEQHKKFVAFVKKQGLAPITQADELKRLLHNAQAAYQQRFNASAQ